MVQMPFYPCTIFQIVQILHQLSMTCHFSLLQLTSVYEQFRHWFRKWAPGSCSFQQRAANFKQGAHMFIFVPKFTQNGDFQPIILHFWKEILRPCPRAEIYCGHPSATVGHDLLHAAYFSIMMLSYSSRMCTIQYTVY